MRSNKKPTTAEWTAGRYVDKEGHEARLGIFYTIDGKPAERPLILPMSDSDSPDTVRRALLDAGADIQYLGPDRATQNDELRRRLACLDVERGVYVRKMGWVGDRFITPANLCTGDHDIIVEPLILDIASQQFSKAGTGKVWKASVAELAQKSSYCAFAIMQALAAPLFIRAFRGGDEGFLVNLAGESSLGKSTCLMAGKSVSGPGHRLSTWEQTPRGFAESAAAFSDTFFPVDDMDKVRSRRGFPAEFTHLLHSLAGGESKRCAAMMKGQLPNLTWTCCRMTGSGITAGAMKGTGGLEKHEQARWFDIRIPSAAEGGIWDRRDEGEEPARLSDQMKAACGQSYGHALHRWLRYLQEEGRIERATKLIEDWITALKLAPDDALGHRVAKKFGLCYAAGILGIEAKILPWDEAFVGDVVGKLHAEARRSLYPYEADVATGVRKLKKEATTCVKNPMPRGQTPSFANSMAARMFARAEQEHLIFITKVYFDRLFGSVEAADLGRTKLRAADALILAADGKSTSQVRVKIGGVATSKKRYLQIDVRKLKRA